jgi:hypothetical protein
VNQNCVSSRVTDKPHLTRRWPFGRVTEGLLTIHELSLIARWCSGGYHKMVIRP